MRSLSTGSNVNPESLKYAKANFDSVKKIVNLMVRLNIVDKTYEELMKLYGQVDELKKDLRVKTDLLYEELPISSMERIELRTAQKSLNQDLNTFKGLLENELAKRRKYTPENVSQYEIPSITVGPNNKVMSIYKTNELAKEARTRDRLATFENRLADLRKGGGRSRRRSRRGRKSRKAQRS